MDLSAMTSANPSEAQMLWDELAAERGDGALTAEKPPANPAPSEPVQVQEQSATSVEPQNKEPDNGTVTAGKEPAAAPTAADQILELAEKYARLEGQMRNIGGHIGGLTTGQQELREMLKTASKAAEAAGGDAPTKEQVTQAMKSPEEWDRLREDFPEFTVATEKLLEAKLAGLQSTAPAFDQAAIDKLVEERVATQTAAVRTEVMDSHLNSIVDGNWRDEVNSEKFGKWLDAQPDDVKALAESSTMADAAKMLRLYNKAVTSNSTQQIIDQRQARLSASTTPRGNARAPKAKALEDMTPQELWNHEAAKRERQRNSA